VARILEILRIRGTGVTRTIASFLIAMVLWAIPSLAQDGPPAGYVIEFKLAGEDASAKTAIVRKGQELPPKLMMPVFSGDVVFLRDPDSRMVVELGGGELIELGTTLMRQDIAGEIDTGDGTWGIIAAIGNIMAGEDEQAPENMVARGGAIKLPMALREGNFLLRGRRNLWLGWTGGKAPYSVALVAEGTETVLARDVQGDSGEFVLPEVVPDKFTMVLRDAERQTVQARFRLADQHPELPKGMAGKSASATRALVAAAWLTSRDGGAWTVEAAQMLHAIGNESAMALLARIQAGWKLDQPAP
jgi:hypothetical protein